jgi:histidyl-tRNA synthetase
VSASKIERVRGTSDILPADYEINKQIEGKLRACFESFGYRPIDMPILEHTDLHLRKSGPDIVSRLYDFVYHNRRLCLRPEMTASVVRAYVEHLQEAPLPLRLYYVGPVFRYEKPQRGRYRQFTQIGIEMFGAPGTLADAEVISAACQGLDRLGMEHYRVSLGHVGILSAFLKSLALDSRLRSFLLNKTEVLKKEGKQHILDRIREIHAPFAHHEAQPDSSPTVAETDEAGQIGSPRSSGTLPDLLQGTDSATTQTAILNLFETMNIQLDATRQPGHEDRDTSEIIDRLLSKTQRRDQTAQIHQALDFMDELAALVGEPHEILPEVERLLDAYHIDTAPLDQLRGIIDMLAHYDVSSRRIRLDLGLGRGLHYYTGMIFEIHHGTPTDDKQLCGGGRYDDLVAVLGSKKDTHATGFAYGIERIRLALESEGKLSTSAEAPADVLVIPVGEDDQTYAIDVAERLRRAALRVELDVRGRSITSNIQYASKRNIPLIAVIGPDEQAAQEVFVKHLRSREDRRIPLDNVAQHIKEIGQDHA